TFEKLLVRCESNIKEEIGNGEISIQLHRRSRSQKLLAGSIVVQRTCGTVPEGCQPAPVDSAAKKLKYSDPQGSDANSLEVITSAVSCVQHQTFLLTNLIKDRSRLLQSLATCRPIASDLVCTYQEVQEDLGRQFCKPGPTRENSILETVVFQQDGDLPHFALIVREYLQVYKVKIKQALCNITPAMLNKVFEVQGVAGKPTHKALYIGGGKSLVSNTVLYVNHGGNAVTPSLTPLQNTSDHMQTLLTLDIKNSRNKFAQTWLAAGLLRYQLKTTHPNLQEFKAMLTEERNRLRKKYNTTRSLGIVDVLARNNHLSRFESTTMLHRAQAHSAPVRCFFFFFRSVCQCMLVMPVCRARSWPLLAQPPLPPPASSAQVRRLLWRHYYPEGGWGDEEKLYTPFLGQIARLFEPRFRVTLRQTKEHRDLLSRAVLQRAFTLDSDCVRVSILSSLCIKTRYLCKL
ncbi:hypothetical protein C0J52_17528, partial [Blattella germanica]